MTQIGMLMAGAVIRGPFEERALLHAREHGWTLVRIQRRPSLLGEDIEEAVFLDDKGRTVYRTEDMIP